MKVFETVAAEVRKFFEELPAGRLDSFYASGDLISDYGAAKICRDLGIHCTYSAETAQYRFERAGWRQEELAAYQVIVA
ncbi:hypothetical protein [Polaromonas sp.]|uniref:hypothetical protein n=1 Tax=Polaromonas sp. TaxID=1869339 RepID=UPI002731F235|nr:hypothetical protein [Polaromonas sp.]MDP1886655.1 hypothetical protein [Polaromonas sp.]